MSILIRGMKMPKESRLTLQISADGAVYVVNSCSITAETYTTDAVPIPPHGRLIDADAFRELYEKWKCDEALGLDIDTFYIPTPVVRQTIDDAPTVVEAEAES